MRFIFKKSGVLGFYKERYCYEIKISNKCNFAKMVSYPDIIYKINIRVQVQVQGQSVKKT